ncbi:MAG: hypothetical protein IPL84_13745 [Chitinophagaceae bacterium]|nr:hypothetical protein [Chitinophagaceae bacterium]
MKKLLLLLFFPIHGFGQNTIGFPDIINYSKLDYKAGLQNWDIQQDNNGIVYIANNEGLLSYDGKNWNLYPLPNKTIVRSVEIGKNNLIYVGGQDELGYFAPTKNGTLTYHSLVDKLKLQDRSFGDVWDIVSFGTDIFFRSFSKIFRLSNLGTLASFNAISEWNYLSVSNNKLYAHDNTAGILKFEQDVWTPLSGTNTLPLNAPVTSILPYGTDSSIVTTLKNGIFIISGSGVSKFPFNNEQTLINDRIYAATRINKDWYVFATSNRGLYITNRTGHIIQRFSRTEGLQNDNVLSIFKDRQDNLWLGLDNGIDFIAYDSPIKKIKPMLQEGSGYTAIIKNGRLYLGTSNALFSVSLQNIKDLSFSKGDFSEVNNSKGQTWSLANINDQLLLGHHEGAFVIKDNTAQRISDITGVWNFKPISTTYPASRIIAGDYKGLAIFNYINGQFKLEEIVPGFNESSRFLSIDEDQQIWVSHPYHGVFKITRSADSSYRYQLYAETKGLPSLLNNHVFIIKNELLAATDHGIFVYDRKKDLFAASPYYKGILGPQSIRYLKEDMDGNIWFIHDKMLGVIDYSKKNRN